ncbi:4-fold beta flower protein [Lysinibacillus sphaericus]|uniref:4-fold beta flower domain-containing protein n=1 Tax=Lysinibacillus sphaericus OT4b.31 TaxID=1285586 RepID=R7Z8K6_LYSSH|nr:hypothetical protein [Lysinibacillus sphaericus]EON70472.1 hypothetical protein H131_21347 [Lysinibacillus sphaericus OT4b.31]
MGNDLVFYNSSGVPIAYCEDEENIYLYNGKPAAYFYNDSIYSFKGKHLGRFNNGWFRDNNGYCVFFTENASGGPFKPMKSMTPIKSMKSMKPIKSVKFMRPMKPMNSSNWSKLSSEIFFDQ